MLDRNITQASDTGNHIDTAGFLNDVKLAETLLENRKQNGGKLSYSDIVFSQRSFLKMKYYEFFDMPWMCPMSHAQAAKHHANVQQQ
jgi:hypothetical protein